MFFPRVKKETMGAYRVLGTPVRVFANGEMLDRVLFVAGEFLPYLKFEPAENAETASVCVSLCNGISEHAEYYELTLQNGVAEICAKDFKGAVNALATFAQAIRFENGVFSIPDAKICDYPDIAYRSFMSDPARNRVPTDELCAQILCMAKAKYNKLHLHLSDGKGFAFTSEKYPTLPVAPGGAYTRRELARIVEYAAAFGIDIIPEVDVPAHSYALTAWMPELKCQREDEGEVSGWNLCLGNPKSYEIVDTILGELSAIFPYEYIHIGTDEMNMTDILHRSPLPISHSLECKVCNALFAPMGAGTLSDRLYYFVRHAYATLKSLGKKMIMWNDDIDISKSPDLPRDILIQFWRVAAEGRGPVEGCSMQRFLEEGFTVINSDFPNAYVEEYVRWEKLTAWDSTKEPDNGGVPDQILGAEMCAWEAKNYPHHDYVDYYALFAFADRVWNPTRPLPSDASVTQALTRASLGCDVPDGFDLFSYTDGVPMGDAKDKDGKIWRKDVDHAKLLSVLKALRHQSADEGYLTCALINIL